MSEPITTETVGNGQPSRAEHLAWCKSRAIEYARLGDNNQAFASMGSDLRKHPDTERHAGIDIGMAMLMNGHLDAPGKMEKFINGFN